MNALNHDDYLLDGGLFRCLVCERSRHPAPRANGDRAYSCGPGCSQPDTAAVPVEQAALLGALIRAYAVLHGVGRGPTVFRAPDFMVSHDDWLPASTTELRLWERCDIGDRRAVLRAAYTRIEIDRDGTIRRKWRRHRKAAG